jgi:hypothetical protein
MKNSSTARSTTATSSFIDFIVRQLDIASLYLPTKVNEVETTIATLKGRFISAERALCGLHETGAVDLVPSSSGAA